MRRIIEIDNALSALFDGFGETVRSLEMDQICLLNDHETILRQNYPGIYRIDVQVVEPTGEKDGVAGWMRDFVAEWDHADYVGKNTPTTKKNRIKMHRTVAEWMPIYIGKSSNIANRVSQHITLPLEKRTVAMKLATRRMWTERNFRLSTMHLPVKHYALIAPQVEAELRAHLNPLVGRQ